MNIKILSSLNATAEERKDILTIGTHNGIFHSDEVVACAILCLINSNMSIHILRTRDNEMLNLCNICVDIGGGKYDHHQPGFNKTRNNCIKYASAGLIWESFGKQLIEQFLVKYFNSITCNVDSIYELFDDLFISLVDCEDNGVFTEKHCFSFISSFLPLWFNSNIDNFNNQFFKALLTTIEILEEELKTTIGKLIAKETIINNWNNSNYFKNGILEIPSQTLDWMETVVNINATIVKNNPINFVIFPYPNGGWAAQCVPPSLEKKFNQRIAFPKEWAGQTDKLPQISGVVDSTFCHNGCFFARANSKEAIIKMCVIATAASIN